jgi:phosphoribosylformylglycinamidine cyclo-ligase
VHVTGGGIRGNFGRILPDGLGIDFDNLIEPLPLMRKLLQMGNIEKEEAYKTWNMGMAMGLFIAESDLAQLQKTLNELNLTHQIVGRVTNQPGISF